MIRLLSIIVVIVVIVCSALVAGDLPGAEWPEGLQRTGICSVCERRGGFHGEETLVAWREFESEPHGFCSDACADAFAQMPLGYLPADLPRPAPEFAWTTLAGEFVQPRGHSLLLVDFWATWCKPCLEAIPDLEQLAEEYSAKGLRIVGVSIDESRAKLDTFLRRRPIGYEIVHDDPDDPAWWQFHVAAIPAAYLVDERGDVIAQWNGVVDAGELRELLRERQTSHRD